MFAKFKVLKSNWGNPSNHNLCMHRGLKSGSDLTPIPLPTHSLVADYDSSLQSASTPNSLTPVDNDQSSLLEHLNKTNISNATENTSSFSANPSFNLLEDFNSIRSEFSNQRPNDDLPTESNLIDLTTNKNSSNKFPPPCPRY